MKIAFYTVVGLHVAAFCVALLFQGCKREQPLPPPENLEPTFVESNLPPMEPLIPEYAEPTSPPPQMVEPPYVPPKETTPPVTQYTVQPGDTFSSIGNKLGISWKAILNANPGVEPTKLKIGQKIIIPPPTIEPSGTVTPAIPDSGEQLYEVKSGDTLSGIARRHNTTVKAIRDANGLVTDRIIVGQKLKIPGKAETPTTTPAPTTDSVPGLPPPSTVPFSQ